MIIDEKQKIVNIEDIKKILSSFRGTKSYYKLSPRFDNFLLTDGTKFIADECQAYWLFRLIALNQTNPKVINHPTGSYIQFWTGKFQDNKGVLTCEWEEDKLVWKTEIPCATFPLPEIKILVANNPLRDGSRQIVAYLPSEY